MKLDFRNPAHIKISLQSEGVKLDPIFFKKFDSKYQASHYHYAKDNKFNVPYPHHMILPQNTVCAINIDDSSRWTLSWKKGSFVLFLDAKFITNVSFPLRYNFMYKKIDKNTRAIDIGFLTTPNSLNIFINKTCYFWDCGKPCHFCGFQGTRNILKDRNRITPERVSKLVNMVKKEDTKINQIYFVGGTYRDIDKGFRELFPLVRAAKKTAPKGWDVIVTNFPPKNLDLIKGLKEAGADRLSFAIEVANPDLFKKICPGKEKYYGHKNFIKAAIYATKYFPNATYLSIIQGLDKKKDLINFMQKMAYRYRIMPTMNIYYNSPFSLMNKKRKRPSASYLYDVAGIHQDLFVKTNIRLFSYGADRHCLDWESFRQMIK